MFARSARSASKAPDEVAQAVLFLASDRAANVHGSILSVDGGASAL
ncbi:SDR family oxidoreductase [Conexibacter stalactiti]|uniref:SDR family oxidoreductase n=1 Tax=Conexibacter stalactiti TaxID=1940611 RepID=A0ABU4HID0_9ACTN|nr:SDR family oxidoreductase [Conexibacter stalactiti]MDW5593058.1 SDR family oxidoreductase [Conexibacter stalactiti]MEC5033699.1 SDR family oxidoreductase [Conexibacter stalactiti]